MGAVEEGGKVANNVVGAFKDQPIALALILINILFIGFVTYVIHILQAETERKDLLLGDLARNCVTISGEDMKKLGRSQ